MTLTLPLRRKHEQSNGHDDRLHTIRTIGGVITTWQRADRDSVEQAAKVFDEYVFGRRATVYALTPVDHPTMSGMQLSGPSGQRYEGEGPARTFDENVDTYLVQQPYAGG